MHGKALAVASILGLASLSCESARAPRVVPGRVTVWASPNDAAVRIRSGRFWAGGHRDTAADSSGFFAVEPDAQVVQAYLDVDGDGTLTHYREPSVDCVRGEVEWRCDLEPVTVTIHRVSVTDAAGLELANLVSVTAEAYADGGAIDPSTRVCLTAPERLCSAPVANMFARTSTPNALSPCQLEASARPGTPLALELRSGTSTTKLAAYAPPRLELDARIEHLDGSIEIRARPSHSPSHAIAWFGSDDASLVLWDTEKNPEAIRLADGELLVTIPTTVLDTCSDCKAMLQVATTHSDGDARSISEARIVVARNGEP